MNPIPRPPVSHSGTSCAIEMISTVASAPIAHMAPCSR